MVEPEDSFLIERYITAKETSKNVHRILARTRLTKIEKDAMNMFYFGGKSMDEIGKSLNVGRKSIDNAIQRVRRKLARNHQLRKEYQEVAY